MFKQLKYKIKLKKSKQLNTWSVTDAFMYILYLIVPATPE